MKIHITIISRFLTAIVAAASATGASGAGFHIEAGAGVAVYGGGDYSLVPDQSADRSADSKDDAGGVVFLAGGYRFNDVFGLKLTYQSFERATTTFVDEVVIAENDVPTIVSAFTDQVQVLTFGPELRWQAAPRFALVLSPELSVVFSDAELRTFTDSPVVQVIPTIPHSDDDVTFGVSVAGELRLSERLLLSARYRHVDMDVSWDRRADVFSLGLKMEF